MRYKKIIKRENGDKIEIGITISVDWSSDKYSYTPSLLIIPKGKRKGFNPVDIDSYEYRRASFPDGRRDYETQQILNHVSPEELYQAKVEAWEQIKPITDK